jgi:hypothetical protein
MQSDFFARRADLKRGQISGLCALAVKKISTPYTGDF